MAEREVSDAELRAYFGRNADYYIGQWRGTAKRSSNWAAFFWPFFWLVYRRLNLIAVGMAVFVVLLGASQEWVLVELLGYRRVPRWIDRMSTFSFFLFCGVTANPLVLRRARRVFAEVDAKGLEGDQRLRELALRGGTRPWHMLGCAGLLVLLVVTAMLVLAALEEVPE
jgi:hypothetical protein